MAKSGAKSIILPLLILTAGFAAIFFLSDFIERNIPKQPEGIEDSDLTLNGSSLRGYLCGTEGLVADWYWMRALQYLGGKMDKSKDEFIDVEDMRNLNAWLLYPYLKNATDLDPGFIAAYHYGALVLPAIDFDKAVALSRAGIANNPHEWRLYQYLGYIYWRKGDYTSAADMYAKGAEIPGSGEFMKQMALIMATRGGARETARSIFNQMLADAAPEDSQTIGNAKMRLAELDAMDEMDAIRSALHQYNEKNAKCPGSMKELLPILSSVQLPGGSDFRIDRSGNLIDPTGAPYLLDKENCDVKIDPAASKLPSVNIWNMQSK